MPLPRTVLAQVSATVAVGHEGFFLASAKTSEREVALGGRKAQASRAVFKNIIENKLLSIDRAHGTGRFIEIAQFIGGKRRKEAAIAAQISVAGGEDQKVAPLLGVGLELVGQSAGNGWKALQNNHLVI